MVQQSVSSRPWLLPAPPETTPVVAAPSRVAAPGVATPPMALEHPSQPLADVRPSTQGMRTTTRVSPASDAGTLWRLLALATACVVAVLTIASPGLAMPQPVRIVLGVLMVFAAPGFAAATSVETTRRFTVAELLVASLGISLSLAVCTAVFLGATPAHLSSETFAVMLGAITLTLSVVAILRSIGMRANCRSRVAATAHAAVADIARR